MKVILLKDVRSVGRHGEVKDVSDGYALNHLIPREFAEQATPEKIQARETATQKAREARVQEEQALAARVQSLEGARIEIGVRATEKGGLFKSLGAADIQKAIRDRRGVDIPTEGISLEKPIKELGDREVEITAAGAKTRLLVTIRKTN